MGTGSHITLLPPTGTETKAAMFPGYVFSHPGAGITGCRCEESRGAGPLWALSRGASVTQPGVRGAVGR